MLFWFALTVLPFSVLGMLHDEAFYPMLLLLTAFLAVTAVDAWRGLFNLDGVSIELPEVIRFSKDRPGPFLVTLTHPRQPTRLLRVGLPLPESFFAEREDQWIFLPAQAERSHLTWSCTGTARGRFPVCRAYLEAPSPMKLWSFRRSVPVRAELRVYPNLLHDRRELAGLFLHRGTFGMHAQRMIGKGREFEKLREYAPGDSYEDIHWKATAKRGHPVTKVFQIERTQEIYVIIDASRLSARPAGLGRSGAQAPGTPPEPALERYLKAALLLGLAAEKQKDLFGLAAYTDRVDHFLRAKNGQAHYHACRDALHTLQPRSVTPDFDEVASFLRLRLRRRALLIFLTALDDPIVAEGFLRGLDVLRRQHLVLVNMIQPLGAEPLFSRGRVDTLDDLYQHLGGHLHWQKLRELEKVLQRRGVRFHLLDHERLSTQLIGQYLDVKRRQLL